MMKVDESTGAERGSFRKSRKGWGGDGRKEKREKLGFNTVQRASH